MKLSEAPIQRLVRVERVDAIDPATDRLREMGVLPGAIINVRMKSPFSGPFILDIGGAFLVMRKKEAELIWVELVS